MDPEAMTPLGLALQAFFEGDKDAELIIRREDGLEEPLPVRHFFREPSEFSAIEKTAMEHCRGRVLDVGAGSGLHSLVLQERGMHVTAIDISPDAVEIMARRKVKDARRADIFRFTDGPFDTLLLMGHGLGMVETVAGLDRFLAHARGVVAESGQILLDSMDVRVTDNPAHLAHHEEKRRAGIYIGENRMQVGFRGAFGPTCGWVHVDPETLADRAASAGWRSEVLVQGEHGDYLARLLRRRPEAPPDRQS